jgi:hypothetical protein
MALEAMRPASAVSAGSSTVDAGTSIEAMSARPAAVICQPAASRRTKAWLKMSKLARASMRFVRSVVRWTSGLRRRVAILRARALRLPGQDLQDRDQISNPILLRLEVHRPRRHSTPLSCDAARARSVPDLTRSIGIQLNDRVSLRRKAKAIAWSAPDIAPHPDPAWRSRRAIILRPAASFSSMRLSSMPTLREILEAFGIGALISGQCPAQLLGRSWRGAFHSDP